jgi:hypothetical protein
MTNDEARCCRFGGAWVIGARAPKTLAQRNGYNSPRYESAGCVRVWYGRVGNECSDWLFDGAASRESASPADECPSAYADGRRARARRARILGAPRLPRGLGRRESGQRALYGVRRQGHAVPQSPAARRHPRPAPARQPLRGGQHLHRGLPDGAWDALRRRVAVVRADRRDSQSARHERRRQGGRGADRHPRRQAAQRRRALVAPRAGDRPLHLHRHRRRGQHQRRDRHRAAENLAVQQGRHGQDAVRQRDSQHREAAPAPRQQRGVGRRSRQRLVRAHPRRTPATVPAHHRPQPARRAEPLRRGQVLWASVHHGQQAAAHRVPEPQGHRGSGGQDRATCVELRGALGCQQLHLPDERPLSQGTRAICSWRVAGRGTA